MPQVFYSVFENPNCSVCDKYVRSGIFCDICKRWSHTKCNNLTPKDFNSLKNSDEKWICLTCTISIFPFNSKDNYNLTENKTISDVKNFFTELNAMKESDESGVENVTGINCKYYNSEEFVDEFSNSKCFSAFHLNIASLTKHFDELQTLLSLLNINFSVIGITETKFLKDIQPSTNFTLNGYCCEHTPTEMSAGGALLYISNHLTYKPRKDLNNSFYQSNDLESVFIEIVYEKKKNVIIGCVYKHPKMCIDNFNNNFLHPLLDKVNKEKKSLILMGDFNINLLHADTDNSVSDFLDILGSYSLLPQVLFPTRVTNYSKSLIDNIFFDSSNFKTFLREYNFKYF